MKVRVKITGTRFDTTKNAEVTDGVFIDADFDGSDGSDVDGIRNVLVDHGPTMRWVMDSELRVIVARDHHCRQYVAVPRRQAPLKMSTRPQSVSLREAVAVSVREVDPEWDAMTPREQAVWAAAFAALSSNNGPRGQARIANELVQWVREWRSDEVRKLL